MRFEQNIVFYDCKITDTIHSPIPSILDCCHSVWIDRIRWSISPYNSKSVPIGKEITFIFNLMLKPILDKAGKGVCRSQGWKVNTLSRQGIPNKGHSNQKREDFHSISKFKSIEVKGISKNKGELGENPFSKILKFSAGVKIGFPVFNKVVLWMFRCTFRFICQ